MRGRRHLAVPVALVAGLLAAATSTAAAAGWQPPVSVLSDTKALVDVEVGVDAQGNAVAVWTQASIYWRRTQAATRPAGGAWSAPVTFQVPDERSGWNPAMAVGAGGDAAAVWSSTRISDPDRQFTMAATRDAGGAWSDPVTLSLQGEDDFGVTVEPAVAVDAQGTTTAVWSESVDEGRVIRTRTRLRGGEWSEPQELTPRELGLFPATPQLAVNPQGAVVAVWTWRVWPESAGIIQAATRPAGGDWSAPVDLSDPDLLMLEPQVALSAQGDAVAVWYSASPMSSSPGVQAARWTAADGWGPVADLSDLGGMARDVAIDPQGTATAVWETRNAVGGLVHASTSNPGGTWSPPVDLSIRDERQGWGADPQVTTDPQGDVTVAWANLYRGVGGIAKAARREAGGAWSPPVDLGQGRLWSIAADPQGYVTALRTKLSSPGVDQIHSAVFDAVAPTLQTVTVPTSGVAGQPVAMSVLASDLWSTVTASWDFGDGGSAVGANVAHCYSTPGTRTVTVTGTDGAGNATSEQWTIDVEPDPLLAPGEDPCGQRPDPPDPPDLPNPPDPPNPPGDGDPPNPSGDEPATAPRLSALRQTAARWRTRAVDRRPRLPVGTTFRFQLDRPANVRLAFTQTVTGRRVAARCVKATKANRGRPRCSSSKPRGALRLSGAAGANAYAFRGRIGNRTLAPGRYRLHVTARRDGRASDTATIAFRVAG
jgi:hypothetical protein